MPGLPSTPRPGFGGGSQPLGSCCTHPRRRPTFPACGGSGGCGPCPGVSSAAVLGLGAAQTPALEAAPWPRWASSARSCPSPCQFWGCWPSLVLACSPGSPLQPRHSCPLWEVLGPWLAAGGQGSGLWHWAPRGWLGLGGLWSPRSSWPDCPASCPSVTSHLWPQARAAPACWRGPLLGWVPRGQVGLT